MGANGCCDAQPRLVEAVLPRQGVDHKDQLPHHGDEGHLVGPAPDFMKSGGGRLVPCRTRPLQGRFVGPDDLESLGFVSPAGLPRFVRPGPPFAGPGQDLDQVLADFLPEPPGPLGPSLNSRGPFGWLGGLIERRHLEPEAEDAAEGLDGFQAGDAPRRMLRTVSVLLVASIERQRSVTPERSISSSRRCLKPLFESEALMRLPSPARRRIRLAGQDFSSRKGRPSLRGRFSAPRLAMLPRSGCHRWNGYRP